ncbi:MAG: hypothetical protein NT037_05495 [Hyphomicrobiales bacterium]|nr:hypothetical protein [Hyphomicrobiales bacterium]
MIEAGMLAALGFLVATFLWLLILPAISRRAERLARRRAELTFPISVDEIAAERDHLRAEYAVRQRELERRSEDSAALRAEALAKVGGLDIEIATLKTTLGVRDVTIADITGRLTDTEADLAQMRACLADEEAGHAATRADLAIRGEALAERDRDIAALRIERADLTATLADRVRDLEAATVRGNHLSQELAGAAAALAVLRDAHAALSGQRDQLEISLSASEDLGAAKAAELSRLRAGLADTQASLAAEQAGHSTTRFAFEQRGAELAALLTGRDSLRQRLKASDDALATQTQIVTELQAAKATIAAQEKASRAEIGKLSADLRGLVADKARLEVAQGTIRREAEARITSLNADLDEVRAKLVALKAERTGLSSELSELRRSAEKARARIEAENGDLRRAIVQVGDAFLERASMSAEPDLPPLGTNGGKAAAKPTRTVRGLAGKPPPLMPDRAAE